MFLDGNGVLTDLDGRFTFTGTELGAAPSVLRVRYIGYVETSQSLDPWRGDKTLEIRLEPDVASIGTAVVSAGRYEQDLGEVSVSIDVLPPELVNQGAPTSADQSLSRTPGVTIVDSEPQIRGGSGYSFGAGSRVAVLLDGLPVLSGDAGRPTWGFLPLENLEQVEVVKGASSVLYGSSALSGVIQFRTAFPDPEPFTRISVQHGVHSDPGNGRKYWNRPLMQSSTSWLHTRRLANGDGISFGGQWLGSDGYKGPQIDAATGQAHDRPYNPFTVDHYDAERQWRINGAWEHAPKNGGWGYGLRANAISGESVGTLLWLDADSGFYAATPGADTRTTQRMVTVDPHLERSVGAWNHRIQGRFLRLINDNDNDQGNASSTWQGEARSQYRGELWTATGGVYAQRTRSVAELYAAGTGDSIHNAANVAGYLQVEIQPHERLHVTAGGRYEQFVLDSVSLGQPVFRTGLNYRFGQASYLRASIGQGFRFPSIAEKFIQTQVGGINVFPSLDIRPESSTNMEIGIKQGFRFGKDGQWKGFLDVAVFQQDFEDFIEYTFGVWGNSGNGLNDLGFRSINTGRARVSGLRVEHDGPGRPRRVDRPMAHWPDPARPGQPHARLGLRRVPHGARRRELPLHQFRHDGPRPEIPDPQHVPGQPEPPARERLDPRVERGPQHQHPEHRQGLSRHRRTRSAPIRPDRLARRQRRCAMAARRPDRPEVQRPAPRRTHRAQRRQPQLRAAALAAEANRLWMVRYTFTP